MYRLFLIRAATDHRWPPGTRYYAHWVKMNPTRWEGGVTLPARLFSKCEADWWLNDRTIAGSAPDWTVHAERIK